MRFVFYTHSLVSDWNHGNAHFLRGVMRELIARGHIAEALEPVDGWSRQNLLADQGEAAEAAFDTAFPELSSQRYDLEFDHAAFLEGADVVLVHEWTDSALVAHIGLLKRELGFRLLFHDTHHRTVSAEPQIADLTLMDYDAVLAFGEALRQRYLRQGWGHQVFTWHEAADDRLFRPMPDCPRKGDLVWVGNWGDGERSAELEEFLVRSVEALGLNTMVHGVRYPAYAKARLASAGIAYGGWIANSDVPGIFASHRVTVHVPRSPYVTALPGIPTIRVFEALACGIPLVSAPWSDVEGLFRAGTDFLMVRGGKEMQRMLREVLRDESFAAELSAAGLETIRSRHTCRHRVDELLDILAAIAPATDRNGDEAAE